MFVWLYVVETFAFVEFQELVLAFDVMFNVLAQKVGVSDLMFKKRGSFEN